jgi:hypothetical protein
MARRYMICPIIGTGQGGPQNSFRAAVSDVPNTGVNAVIPSNVAGTPETNPNYGKPLYLFAFCIINTENIGQCAQISNSYILPDQALDTQMGAMEASARTSLTQDCESFDLNGANLHLNVEFVNSDSYRQVLQSIGTQFDPSFSINYFDAN